MDADIWQEGEKRSINNPLEEEDNKPTNSQSILILFYFAFNIVYLNVTFW